MKLALIAAGFAGIFVSTISNAADIRVLASGATKEVLLDLIPRFEKESGNKVVTTWSGSADIKKRIAAGEAYDLVIVGGPVIDAFIQQGKIVPGSRVDLMKSGIGVAVHAGAPKPDIASSEALKATLLAAKSIAYSTGPSGDYMLSLFDRLGIADQIKPKLKQVPSGTRISSSIMSGEAEIGFQQISELIEAPGLQFVGPLPSNIQKITVFSAGTGSGAKEPEMAKALTKSLSAPTAAEAIKRHGMEPG